MPGPARPWKRSAARRRRPLADEFIRQCRGIRDIIGDRGLKLSGGQRSASPSPALLKNAPILISTKPLELDTESEMLVQKRWPT